MGKNGLRPILFIDNAKSHMIDFTPYANVEVMFFKLNMTGYIQPLDMGFFATVKKRFRRYRRNWLQENDNALNLREIIKNVVDSMLVITA